MNIILTVIGLLLIVLLTSAIFMLGLVDPRSTKVSESAKGFMTLLKWKGELELNER